ncbi:MAG: hypothetical protein JW734_10040 [Candidatus Omnitrophica bacterium]|nr:hypothetical protein [Candidatus Omnitrophota bacterium]
MDEQEKLRLQKEYELSSDEDILQMLAFSKDEYEEGVYELVLEEAKKRGLDKRKGEVSPIGECRQSQPKDIEVLSTIVQEAVINILEKKGIVTRGEIIEEVERMKKEIS